MLSGPLQITTFRKSKAYPKFLKPEPAPLELAQTLLELAQVMIGESLETLEAALSEVSSGNPKVTLGLVKVLLEQGTFRQKEVEEPASLREQVFDLSARYWNGQATALPEVTGHREQILKGHPAIPPGADPLPILFADLPSHQVLLSLPPQSAGELLDRYNLAQAQGLLLKADSLTLEVLDPDCFAGLLQRIRFFGLLFEVEPLGSKGNRLVISGPGSVLENPRSYGLELANLFPSLLGLKGQWSMEAWIRPQGKTGGFGFEVTPDSGYRSQTHLRQDWGQEKILAVEKRFNQQYNPHCTAKSLTEVIRLPGNRYLLPDLEVSDGKTKVRVQWLRYLSPQKQAWLLAVKDQLPLGYLFVLKGQRVKYQGLVEALGGKLALVTTDLTAPFLKKQLD